MQEKLIYVIDVRSQFLILKNYVRRFLDEREQDRAVIQEGRRVQARSDSTSPKVPALIKGYKYHWHHHEVTYVKKKN